MLIFREYGRKTQFVGNFEKIFESFLKDFHQKIAKNTLFLAYFSKNLTNRALLFARLDENTWLGNFGKVLKIFDENSIEKLNFYFIFILENLLLKI